MKTGYKVLKFGGTSLATVEALHHCAKLIREESLAGGKLCVVVSAMGSRTDDLLKLAYSVSGEPDQRELDMLLSTGERISCSLLAMALKDLGLRAVSLTGSQSGIFTNKKHQHAEIIEIRCHRVFEAFEENDVVLVAGFQGVDPVSKEITTLGRGGSDLTAVALAQHLQADSCLLFTDVNGIKTMDPRISKRAETVPELSWKKAFQLSCQGAKVLHYRAAHLALQKRVPLEVVNTWDHKGARTLVGSFDDVSLFLTHKEGQSLVEVMLDGLSHDLLLGELLTLLWAYDETPSLAERIKTPEGKTVFRLLLRDSFLGKVKEFFEGSSSFLGFKGLFENLQAYHFIFPNSRQLDISEEKLKSFFLDDSKFMFSHRSESHLVFSYKEILSESQLDELYSMMLHD